MSSDGDKLPKPMSTIDSLLDGGDTSEKAYKVFVGNNLGARVFLAQIPMHEFFEVSDVANDAARDGDAIAQRKLDPAHAQKLAVYILKGLVSGAIQKRVDENRGKSQALETFLTKLGRQPYMALQPIVTNIRACEPNGTSIRGERLVTKENVTAAFQVLLSQKHILWVVDGQHRRMAMQYVFDFLDSIRRNFSYPKKGSLFPDAGASVTREDLSAWEEVYTTARSFTRVAVEIHLGLSPEQERQLFHDLNNLGKRVDRNLALTFDNSNPVNLFIKETLHDTLGLSLVEREVKDWSDDQGAISWKDMVAVNAILFLNKTNIAGAKPDDVEARSDVAKQFWEAVLAIPGFGEHGAKEKTVAAQPVVLKALAKLTYDFAFSNRRPANSEELLQKLQESISDFDFSHDNPLWRYYELSQAERDARGLAGLEKYLPTLDGGNRDIGAFQGGVMRFGAKHNDIYPILGDMIRWKIGLPGRRG